MPHQLIVPGLQLRQTPQSCLIERGDNALWPVIKRMSAGNYGVYGVRKVWQMHATVTTLPAVLSQE